MTSPEIPKGMIVNIKRAIEAFKKILADKHRLDLKKQLESEEEKKKHETIEKRREQKEKKEAEERQREYHQRRSAQKRAEEVNLEEARKEIQNLDLKKAKEETEKSINQPEPDPDKRNLTGYEQNYYVFRHYSEDELRNNNQTDLRSRLEALMERNPKIAEAILLLSKKDAKVHEDPAELLRLGTIINSNTPSSEKEVVGQIINEIKARVKYLIDKRAKEISESSRFRRGASIQENVAKAGILENLAHELEIYISADQKEKLVDMAKYEEGINDIFSVAFQGKGEVEPSDSPSYRPKTVAREAIDKVDKIWERVEQAQRSEVSLNTSQIDEIKREIYRAESASFPSDIFPGSKDYKNAVNALHAHTETKLNQLAEMLARRIKEERPEIKTGITNTEEFFLRMGERGGILGDLLLSNPEMYKLFKGTGEKSYKFRNQIFLRNHNAVLTQRREASNDNFGLYERVDFTAFTTLLKEGMKDLIVPETGESVGQTWVDYYTGLSNTIRHSRDIDFWATQPGATMENFNRSLAMFQNEYTAQALSIPAVDQAFRAYETALTTIRDGNDGYIPPGLIDYDAVNKTSYWDVSAKNLFLSKMAKHGVVKDAKRDYERMGGLEVVSEDGVSYELGETMDKVDPLEAQMYMTLAKGFGMASMRLMEIIANTKIPGVEVPGFRSPAFEGIITAINHWNVFIKKWSHFSYKYFHMINSVLPDGQKLPVGKGAAEKAYRAYIEGRFSKEYGDQAMRMIDTINFSRTHTAFGPGTPWRTLDDSIGWTDKQRELLGGATRILLAHKLAGEDRVKQLLIGDKYKEEFRQRKRSAGQPYAGSDFEALWLSEGMALYGDKDKIDVEWREYKHRHKKEVDSLINNLQKAYKSRMWVETAMRNPIAIAHNATIEVPIKGYENKTKQRKLHSYIVEQVLGITPEDLETGTVVDGDMVYQVNAAKYSSPTKTQRAYLNQVMDLEGDMAAVKEKAMEENRELIEDDFNILEDDKRRKDAVKYWNIVKKFITGSEDPDYKKIYKDLGITYRVDPQTGREMEYYDIDWERIQNADEEIFKGLRKNFKDAKAYDDKFLDYDWWWYFSTDDTAFRKMAFLNLGNRQWVRRGGDIQAHFQGGQAVDEYIQHSILPNPDKGKLAEQLLKIRDAYTGDDVNVGYRVAGHMADLTSKLYAFDYKRLGSAAQMDVWNTRRHVAAWTANGRREFWDAVEHLDVLPPHAEFEHYSPQYPMMTVHKLQELNRAGNKDVWTEILLLGVAVAVAMTIWRAFTAKSEEEEGGGGH